MTFFHLLNCLALSYSPCAILYKVSGLSENSASWKCGQAAAMYFATQFIKMLLLATFFPEIDPSASLDLVGEFMRCSIDIGDLVGLHFIMSRITSKGSNKVLIAAIGWATAEFAMTRIVPFWIGARGSEFDWVYIQMSLETNLRLMQHLSTAALVMLFSRKTQLDATRYGIIILLLSSLYKPIIVQLLTHFLSLGPWMTLFVKFFHTACVSSTVFPLFCRTSTYSY